MAKTLTALLLIAGASCGGATSPTHTAPLPDLDALDVTLAERIREAHAAVVADDAAPAAWMELGMIYESNELAAPAIECYGVAIDLYTGDATLERAQAWARIGQARRAAGEIEAAADAMRRSIEYDDSYAPTHWRLGTYLFDLGRFDEAKLAYERAIECDPEHLGGWNGVARVLIQVSEPEQAIEVLQSILERAPDDASARRLLRTALVHAGRGNEAAKLQAPWRRKSALGRDPWHREFRKYRQAPPVMEQARDDLQAGKFAEAIEALEEFAEDQPDDMNVLSYLAWGYYQIGQRDAAQATIDRALTIDERSAAVLRVLARIQRSDGDSASALTTLDRILAADPNDTTTLLEKAKVSRAIGRTDDALGIYARMLQLDQSNGDAWLGKADCEATLERWSDAAESYRAALRLLPKEASAPVGLARALASDGKWELAQSVLEKVKRLDSAGAALLESIRERKL